MSILKSLLASFRPHFAEDPVFGRIRFHRVGLWEGRLYFRGIDGETEVTVDADKEGPTDLQRALYRELELRYAEMLERILDVLPEHLPAAGGDNPREALREDLRYDGIAIGSSGSAGTKWSVTYYIKSLGKYATVEFLQWDPVNVVIDG